MTKKRRNKREENVTEILLNGPVRRRGFSHLFVEGKADKRFWKRYRHGRCDIRVAGDQEMVIAVIKALWSKKLPKEKRSVLRKSVAGIVDPDYDLIASPGKLKVRNLLYDDVPDLENIVVHRTLHKIVRKSGVFKRKTAADRFVEHWLNCGMELSIAYGYFRIVSRQNPQFKLVPNSIEHSYRDYINFRDFQLDYDKTANMLVIRSPNARVSVSELLKIVDAAERLYGRCKLLVRGKDLLNFLLCACLPVFDKINDDESVRAKLINWLRIVCESDKLFRNLQSEYKCEDLKCTKLYVRIGNWESANKPYKILKPDI